MNCAGCKGKLGKKGYKIQCTRCEEWYHEACTSLDKDEIKKVRSGKEVWECDDCRMEDGDSNDEGLDGDSESEEEMPKKTSPGKQMKQRPKITLEDLYEKLELVVAQNEKMIRKIAIQEKESKQMKKEIKHLKMEQEQIKKELCELKNEKTYQRQDQLKNNIIVSGITTEEKSVRELKNVFVEIGKKLKVDLEEEDLECYKIGGESVKHLKVVFKKEDIKEKIMKSKKNISLNTKDFGFQEDKVIYINHDLTKENQRLFSKTREAKTKLKYKYAWFSQGKIWMRKTDSSKAIHVKSEEVLENLMGRKE